MSVPIDKHAADTTRLTTRVPRDWIPLLEQIAASLSVPGRGGAVADAVRALILEGFKNHGITVKSVVQAREAGK